MKLDLGKSCPRFKTLDEVPLDVLGDPDPEVWLAHAGAVTLEYGGSGAAPEPGRRVVVGTDRGQETQALVPAQGWQRTLPSGGDALVSRLVSPGFDLADFELA